MACCCSSSEAIQEVITTPPKESVGLTSDAPAEPAKDVEEPAASPASSAKEFTIKLNKVTEKSIGLDITRCATPVACLRIKKVKAGLVSNWNSSNPDQVVQEDDRIVSVNGVSGDADNLLERIAKDSSLEVEIKRF